jgi:hypothetical protein
MIVAIRGLPDCLYTWFDQQWLLNLTQRPGGSNPTGQAPLRLPKVLVQIT